MPNLSGDASAIPSWVSQWQGKRPVIAVGLSPAAYYAQGLTIEQLGESIASKSLSYNPESPVHLLGLSFGGKLAWEVALRLNRSGQQVGQVVIGDASARSGDAPNVIAQSARIIVHFPKWLQNELRKKDRNSLSILRSWRLLRKLVAGLTRRVQLSIKSQEKDSARQVAKHFDLQNRSEVQRHFMASAWNAAASYRPCPAPISLFLIRCRIRPLLGDYSEDLGWRAVVEGSFVAEDVDIDHEALFNSNHTMRIVSRIESELAVFDRSQRRINFGKVETLELD
jgi:thioesterase domain-containing protein